MAPSSGLGVHGSNALKFNSRISHLFFSIGNPGSLRVHILNESVPFGLDLPIRPFDSQNSVCLSLRYIIIRVSDPHFFCGSGSGQKSSCGSGSGIRGRGLGVKGKNDFFLSFYHVSDDS